MESYMAISYLIDHLFSKKNVAAIAASDFYTSLSSITYISHIVLINLSYYLEEEQDYFMATSRDYWKE